MANIKSLIILAASLLTVACAQNPERTLSFKGEWTQEQKALVVKATDEWCDKTGDCIDITDDSANTIELKDECTCTADAKHPVGCTRIRRELGSGKVETKILIRTDADNLLNTTLHELGHMLVGGLEPVHASDEKAVMFPKENSTVELTQADVDWYFEYTTNPNIKI